MRSRFFQRPVKSKKQGSFWRAFFFAIISVTATNVPAQIIPPEIQTLRETHSERWNKSLSTLNEQFIRNLYQEELKAGSRGDYELALKIKNRRNELSFSPKLIVPNVDAETLLPSKARLSGAVNYDQSLDALVGFKTNGSTASWSFMKITPGIYQVKMIYSTGGATAEDLKPRRPGDPIPTNIPERGENGGTFIFYEQTSLSGSEVTKLNGKVTETGSWNRYRMIELGNIHLMRTSATLVLETTRGSTIGMMRLKGIQLVPISAVDQVQPVPSLNAPQGSPRSETALLTTPPPATTPEIENLKIKLKETARTTISPYAIRYARALREIKRLHPDHVPETEGNLERESDSYLQFVRDYPMALPEVAAAPAPEANRYTSFEAKLSSPPEIAHFLTVQRKDSASTPIKIRLLGIASPPVELSDHTELLEACKTFFISRTDALTIGTAASKFVESLLSSQPFRVELLGDADAQGAQWAEVYVKGHGSLSKILLNRGLAHFSAPPTKLASAGRILDLKEIQNQSQAKRSGAWALSDETLLSNSDETQSYPIAPSSDPSEEPLTNPSEIFSPNSPP